MKEDLSGDGQASECVDTKAFKGRGERGGVLRTYAHICSLSEVRAEMTRLVALTLSIPGRPIRLTAHKRLVTGQVAVRWRHGAGGGHISWSEFGDVIQKYPEHLRVWYQRVFELARELNSRELELRAASRRKR